MLSNNYSGSVLFLWIEEMEFSFFREDATVPSMQDFLLA